jgi:LuxR family maltose regulon positive regulatory protein
LEAEGGTSLQDNELQILQAQLLLLRAEHAYFSKQPKRATDLCRQAFALLPASWTFGRGAALLFLGLSMQAIGRAQEAERLLLAEYESYGDKTDIYALFILESLCYIYLLSGQLEQNAQIAQLLLKGAYRSRIALMKNMGDWFLGLGCYYRNELETAAQHFTQIFENRYTAQITAYRDAVAGLALIHQIKGESFEAFKMVESISQFDLEASGSEDNRTRSLRARLLLLQGDLEGACRWADAFTDPPPNLPLMWLEEPQVTRARVLVARGADDDPQLVMQILDALDEIAERTFHTRYKIEILALRALALSAAGETRPAEAVLIQALDLARPGGFIRVFVDLGEPMRAMLRRLVSQGHSVETIHRILAAFPAEYSPPEGGNNVASRESLAQPAPRPTLGNSTLAEPLTRRELEVLALLQGPSSTKEIAQRLNISYATAKDHTIKIYAKLGVNRRWDAVARAEELNILPPR